MSGISSRRYSRHSWIAIWIEAAVGIARMAPMIPNRVLPKRTATRTTNGLDLGRPLLDLGLDHVVLDLLVGDREHDPDDQRDREVDEEHHDRDQEGGDRGADHRDQVEEEDEHGQRPRERGAEDR